MSVGVENLGVGWAGNAGEVGQPTAGQGEPVGEGGLTHVVAGTVIDFSGGIHLEERHVPVGKLPSFLHADGGTIDHTARPLVQQRERIIQAGEGRRHEGCLQERLVGTGSSQYLAPTQDSLHIPNIGSQGRR